MPLHLYNVGPKTDSSPSPSSPTRQSLAGGIAKTRLVPCSASQPSKPSEIRISISSGPSLPGPASGAGSVIAPTRGRGGAAASSVPGRLGGGERAVEAVALVRAVAERLVLRAAAAAAGDRRGAAAGDRFAARVVDARDAAHDLQRTVLDDQDLHV